MKTRIAIVFFCLAIFFARPVSVLALEYGVNRPGMDYFSFQLSAPIAEICQDACNRDHRCQSFTFVRPGVQGANAVCWLKFGAPAPVPAGDCCISGLRGQNAGGSFIQLEYGINRPGNDYFSFILPGPIAEICRDACARDPHCRSFTFVRPGVQGPDPVCWLKNRVSNPFPGDCCISGHK